MKRANNVQRKRAMKIPLSLEHRKQMNEFYANCPPGYEVDHMHPLCGPNFCGLHVPWNLQYLPGLDNRKKGNQL